MPRPNGWEVKNILTSHHLSSWAETENGVRAEFIDKATGKAVGHHDGALLIAADGIHSAIREKLYPDEGPPIWNGRILWRGITTSDAFLSGRTMIMAGHEILKFVCYPISKEADASGKFRINWIAERHMPPTYQWRREDYNRTAKLDEFLPWFEDWKFDWLDVPGLIRNCPHAYEYPLVDRDPIPQWTFGRVTLMGDAAHPMYPVGSNGASQAILDARVLTREILTHGPTNAALLAYEAERRPATTDLVMLNRRNGPEQVMQLVEERAPNGYSVVTDVLSLRELEDIAANYKRVAGFQVEGLNAKPSIVQMRDARLELRSPGVQSSDRAPSPSARRIAASPRASRCVQSPAPARRLPGRRLPAPTDRGGQYLPPARPWRAP